MRALNRNFSELKEIAYATPIIKKGDKLDSTNYRRISVTSFAKIFERLFLTQMMEFIDRHKYINKEPFGFQKKVCNRCSLGTG